MKKNIFENAKFGDKFLTRDGRIVIFYYKDENGAYAKFITIINNEPQDLICLLPNGNYCLYENQNDIVSRYQEPIDEKKLNEFASNWDGWNDNSNESQWEFTKEDICSAYKAGYRKAMKE